MASSTYAAHRETQRELILETAQALFIAGGIERTSIGDIALGSRLTRATVYKYFPNKEAIAGEIYKGIAKGWAERNKLEVWAFGGSGMERLQRFVLSHFDNLFRNPYEARMTSEFNYMYSKHLSVEAAKKVFLDGLEGERRRLLACIKTGQKDGSIRADIKDDRALAAVLNFTSGLMNRLGELGDKVEGEYGLGVQDIFRQICELFLEGLRARPTRRVAVSSRGPRPGALPRLRAQPQPRPRT
ncbi:MAG: TetR/AcrR family transcriptional regulator [Treponema sp.]|nr:TetR/AcrR family transcriptional regulator [Treponema sp.]